MITHAELKSILCYDPDTGHWTWLVNRARMAKAGQRAGTPHYIQGYIRLHIKGKMYQAHSLAYFYMTGEWPADEIDHINGIRDDNRWTNLRPALRKMNLLNRKTYSSNTSGQKGVSWHPKLGKWRVRIQKYGRRVALGCYDTLGEAREAYEKAAEQMFGEFKRDENGKGEAA